MLLCCINRTRPSCASVTLLHRPQDTVRSKPHVHIRLRAVRSSDVCFDWNRNLVPNILTASLAKWHASHPDGRSCSRGRSFLNDTLAFPIVHSRNPQRDGMPSSALRAAAACHVRLVPRADVVSAGRKTKSRVSNTIRSLELQANNHGSTDANQRRAARRHRAARQGDCSAVPPA